MKELDNTAVSKHLGQTSSYKSTYDKSLLVRERRQNNREHLGITDGEELPFVGTDTWNCYEVSALTNTGMPVSCVLKIVYGCDSEYIVESKSLKLYLNSFNMEKLGRKALDVYNEILSKVQLDLEELLETEVHAQSEGFKESSDSALSWNSPANGDPLIMSVSDSADPVFAWDLERYTTLEDVCCDDNIVFNKYVETPGLLRLVDKELEKFGAHEYQHFHSALLKSNCRVTSQPDWGDILVSIRDDKYHLDAGSLLQYIVSFRDENHFHEEICETVFVRLKALLPDADIRVMCLYARRGGIDINPQRASSIDMLHTHLANPYTRHCKTYKQ